MSAWRFREGCPPALTDSAPNAGPGSSSTDVAPGFSSTDVEPGSSSDDVIPESSSTRLSLESFSTGVASESSSSARAPERKLCRDELPAGALRKRSTGDLVHQPQDTVGLADHPAGDFSAPRGAGLVLIRFGGARIAFATRMLTDSTRQLPHRQLVRQGQPASFRRGRGHAPRDRFGFGQHQRPAGEGGADLEQSDESFPQASHTAQRTGAGSELFVGVVGLCAIAEPMKREPPSSLAAASAAGRRAAM